MVNAEYWFDSYYLLNKEREDIEVFANENKYNLFEKRFPYSPDRPNKYVIVVAPWK